MTHSSTQEETIQFNSIQQKMATIAKLTLPSSPLTFNTSFLPKSPSLSHTIASPKRISLGVKVCAQLGNIKTILSIFSLVNFHANIMINMVVLVYICCIRWSR